MKAGCQDSEAEIYLKDRSQSLTKIKRYEDCELEPELRLEFVKEIDEAHEQVKFVKVEDFAEEFDLKVIACIA